MCYVGGIRIELVKQQAKAKDNLFMGTIVLYALGIDGVCESFGLSEDEKLYHIAWFTPDDTYNDRRYTLHVMEDDIIDALKSLSIYAKRN